MGAVSVKIVQCLSMSTAFHILPAGVVARQHSQLSDRGHRHKVAGLLEGEGRQLLLQGYSGLPAFSVLFAVLHLPETLPRTTPTEYRTGVAGRA